MKNHNTITLILVRSLTWCVRHQADKRLGVLCLLLNRLPTNCTQRHAKTENKKTEKGEKKERKRRGKELKRIEKD